MPVYIVHLSAPEALEQVAAARDRGLPAYRRDVPAVLFLSYDNYEEPGFEGAKYVMSPPLRDEWDQEELWSGLRLDDLQAVVDGSLPVLHEGSGRKELGRGDFRKIPNGAPGVETRMNLIYDGGVVQDASRSNRYVEITSTSPAQNLRPVPEEGHDRRRQRRRRRGASIRTRDDHVSSARRTT